MTDKIVQVRIGQNLIGLYGLQEIFQEFLPHSLESPEPTKDELLKRVAAQNYIPRGAEGRYRQAVWREFCKFRGEKVEEEAPAELEIKVLGAGCMGCQLFYQQVMNILAAKDIQAGVQYITDPLLLKDFEVRAFPALVINGRIVLAGRMPSPVELEGILMEAEKECSERGRIAG